MRIKSLQITGFKSFVDKTVFHFEPGITAIVGPNGCGKSNVVDAMRWAMGEQSPRRLRGKGMEDVIFAGAEGRAPVGMAEVVLSFDNHAGRAPGAYAGFSEIQVTRRLYRSGESEYYINKVQCRMRDVLDFFRDTGIGTKGYTIVEQGQIAAIVSSKPEERRVWIEEAAGIGKYKARRAEAERKLASTEQNLLRVADVLREIGRQIASLERQARRAERYKRLRDQLRGLELSLAADERRDHLGAIETAGRHAAELRAEVTGAETRLAEREAALEGKRLALAEHERAVSRDSEALGALRGEIKQLESRIEYETRERASLGEANATRRDEIAQLREQLATAEEEARRSNDSLREVEAALAGEAASIEAAELEARQAAEGLRELETERDAASAALVEVMTRIARAEDRTAALEDRRDELDRRLRSTDAALELQTTEAARVDRERAGLEEGLANLLAERDRLQDALRDALDRERRLAPAAQATAAKLQELRDARELRRARLESLREVLERREDVGAGTRFLLEQGDAVREAHGLRALVREVLVVEPGFEPAVEAVLAERAEAVVVARPESAVSALDALREAGAGRGVFLAAPDAGPTGFVPLGEPLAARVRAEPGYESVARALFDGVNVVADLGEVLRVYGGGRLPCSFVTPGGDVIAPDGLIAGGGPSAGTGALARVREVRELEAEVARLDAEVSAAAEAHVEAEAALTAARDELENLRNRNHTAALAVANHEKDLERTRERRKAIGEAQEGRAAERSELLAEAEAGVVELGRLHQALETARRERSDGRRVLDALSLRLSSARRNVSRCDGLVAERRVERQGRIEKRDALAQAAARAGESVRETREWIARREREMAAAEARQGELAESLAEAEQALAGRLDEEESARRRFDARRDHYERESAAAREIEAAVRELRGSLHARREGLQAAELAAREAELRLENLEASARERWNVDLESWVPTALDLASADEPGGAGAEAGEAAEGGDAAETSAFPAAAREQSLLDLPRDERRRLVKEARRKLEALGDVNLGAIEEHEELGERFRFLSEQKADLEGTIATLRDAIARINRTSRRRFREAFEAVNARFVEVFPRLFRGGKATLTLSEDDDVLEAGIDIVAMPPGKRLQNVNLLSGGEKTLTAIALLISLFQVRPSPFFLLDEVDAALDDANVSRFNEIVQEMAKGSQFLLITHNKNTIEVADVLYGVTMEERGVSKLVSVELH